MTPGPATTGPRPPGRPGPRAFAVLVAALAAGTSCSGEEPPTALTLPYAESIIGGAVDSNAQLYLYGLDSIFAVPSRPGPGSRVVSAWPDAADEGEALGVNRDAGGQVWVFAGYDHAVQVVGLSGPVANRVHPADGRVGALLGVHDRVGADDEPVDPVPPNLPRHDRSFAAGAVVDAESLVVGTNGGCRYTGVHECDALVWRVTATGSVPVAGRISPFTPVKDDSGRWFRPVLKDPAQDLPVGWSVPAGEVDLPNVSAILPLPGGRILLIAGGSDDSFSPVPGRLWAFVVEGDRIRRLATPATMSAVSQVGLSQVSGGRGLLTTPSVDEKNTEGHWLIDPGAGATRPVVPVGGSVVGNGSDRYVKATLDGDAHRVTLTSWPVPPGG